MSTYPNHEILIFFNEIKIFISEFWFIKDGIRGKINILFSWPYPKLYNSGCNHVLTVVEFQVCITFCSCRLMASMG